MTSIVRRKDTGEEVELLAFTGDDLALVAPLGDRPHAVLVPRDVLEPDHFWTRTFRPWTQEAPEDAEA